MSREKRCGSRQPKIRCRLALGHEGRHTSGWVSWNNLRDPDCFWCGRKASSRVRVGGFGKATVCDDFIRLSDEHYPGYTVNGHRTYRTYGQGCRDLARAA